MSGGALVLTLNAGSSSIKFGLYEAGAEPDEAGAEPDGADAEPAELMGGQVERLGGAARLRIDGEAAEEIGRADHAAAVRAVIGRVRARMDGRNIGAVGHRVVHGGPDHDRPVVLDDATVEALAALAPLAPLHQTHNLAGVRATRAAFPGVPQVACFDTAFHRGQPFVEDAYALPLRFYDEGVRRYGFHGLSYDYIAGWLLAHEPALHAGRTIVAHLGNGASMCALLGGRSVASTMGFSPLDGLAMGTRCGQIDPAVLLYLMEGGMDAEAITALLYRESGLRGLSGGTSDMRELLASGEDAAKRAVSYFLHRIRREIGSLAAVLGGLDGIVFTGGIGENAAPIRAMVAEGMDWIGLAIDPDRNAAGARDIGAGTVRALVVPTDEERVIARAAAGAVQ